MEKTTEREALRFVLLTTNYSADEIKNNEIGGACGTYEGEDRCLQCFGGESECKRTPGRPRHRWEKSIKMYFQEVLWDVGMNWIDLAQCRGRWRALVNAVINPYPTAFPYGNGMVLRFYQQQDSSTTKTVHKVINKGLKTYV